jgi:hypothetical protein
MFNRILIAVCGLSLLPAAASAEKVFGVTNTQMLVSWESAAPGTLLSGAAISGLQPNETLLGIDFRPLTKELFAVGSSSRLYTLSTSTGAATMVGAAPFTPAASGASFGFDFNPTIDRIRFVSDTNKNTVLNPLNGTATAATDVFFPGPDVNSGMDPNVVHHAYTNNFAGATTSQLYGIDTTLNLLVTQANSAGTLGTVGPLGVDVTSTGGFDISGDTGMAYLTTTSPTAAGSSFWSVNLMTGQGTAIGAIGSGAVITAMSVAPIPEPTTLALAAILCLAGATTRRA